MTAPALAPEPVDVIGLLRVSTDVQDVARQRTALQRIAKRFNLRFLHIVELVGVSGTDTLKNEDVQKILTELKQPGIRGLAVYSLDRLFRPGKRLGQFAIVDPFMEENKVIYTEREGECDPNTEEGYNKIVHAGGAAGAEWRKIQQLSRDGKAEKVAQGRIVNPANARVYGYVYVPKHPWNALTCENHPVREVDPHKCGQFLEFGEQKMLDVITSVYEERALNTPAYRVAKRLNEAGIPSAKGGLWSKQTILQLIAHPEYNGRHIHNGEVIACPKLIDDELWNKCQEVRESGKPQWVGRPSEIYLLRGWLWCRRCGKRHVGILSGSRKVRAYRCGHRTQHPPVRYLCDGQGIVVRQDLIEPIAFGAIWNVLTDADLLLELGRAYYDSMARPASASGGIEQLRHEAARLAEDEAHVIQMTRRRMYTFTQGEAELKIIRDRMAQIKTELKNAGQTVTLPPKQAVEATLRRFANGTVPQGYKRQRDILEGLQDLHMEYENGELEITGKVPVYDESAESTTSVGKKCSCRIDGDSISLRSIPFILKRRVA